MIIKLNVDDKKIIWVHNQEIPDMTPEEWTAEVFQMLRRLIERSIWKETGVELETVKPDIQAMGNVAR